MLPRQRLLYGVNAAQRQRSNRNSELQILGWLAAAGDRIMPTNPNLGPSDHQCGRAGRLLAGSARILIHRNFALEIVDVRIIECTQRLKDPSWKFARALVPQLQGHVLELTDDTGVTGLGYVHAIPAITTHGAGARSALDWIKPTLLHRRIDSIASVMEELDLLLAFNSSVKAAVDMALHDLLGKRSGLSVATLLGGRM